MEEIGQSCINIVTVKIGDDPADSRKVNDIALHLMKLNIFQLTLPHALIRYFVYTDHPEDPNLDKSLGIIPIPLELQDGITNPDYYKLDMFNNKIQTADGKVLDDKCVVWDINLMPRDGCQQIIINGMPHAGEVADQFLEGDIDTDLIKKIRENKYDYIRMSSNWTDDDQEFNSWYIEFQNWNNRNLAMSKEDIKDPNDFDLCKYIKDNHTGIILATPPGVFSPFYADNREMNEALNDRWVTHVMKYFPAQWEGHGGEETDSLYYYEHEWKRINAQCKFLYVDEGHGVGGNFNRYNDLYLRLWVF